MYRLDIEDKKTIKKELLKYMTLYEEEKKSIEKILQKFNLNKN